MALSVDLYDYTSYFALSPRAHTEPALSPSPPLVDMSQKPALKRRSQTQYEFITMTADESAKTARQKLKTVRSHVMKNYMQHHQPQRHRRESKGVSPGIDMRKSKRRRRSIGSPYPEFEPTLSAHHSCFDTSASVGPGALLPGASLAPSFSGDGFGGYQSLGEQTAFTVNFGYSAMQDEVSYAAQKYVDSLVQDKELCFEPSYETINAQMEVVRLVQETLSMCGSEVPESTIFAMALLAFGCARNCEWDQARGHLEALQSIVESRGGVQTIDIKLQRTFIWTSYCIDGALRLPPRFPPPLFPSARGFPLAFLDEAQIGAWRTIKRFPKDSSFAFDLVSRLHHLALATSSEWYSDIDPRALSNLFFESMHDLLAFQCEEPWMHVLPSGIQGRETALMFSVWTTGLPLFIRSTLRQVQLRLGLMIPRNEYEPVLVRIKDTLEAGGGHHSWPRGKKLEPVLATLIYGIESCDRYSPWRSWAIETIRKIVEMLKLKRVEDMHKVLDFFPSVEGYKIVANEVWAEVNAFAGMTPVSLSGLEG